MGKNDKIRRAYIDYQLTVGHRPPSVYAFAKKLKITEANFYESYNSFAALEKDIWRGFMEDTLGRLQQDEVYQTYTVREKLLAFYYTFVEVLKENRSYILNRMAPARSMPEVNAELAYLHDDFRTYAKELVREGEETGEVAQRPYLTDRYGDGLWYQLLFVLRFWRNDESAGFEKTDAAIEKAVHLSFDLIGRNTIDSAFDFARFIFQNRRTVSQP
ncbi:DNA-binding transcriptional regulator, AcrR family [Catalinimonas alkaloidigena]|uniref:DNA-binding transcriptional regulator, AcrR family n=1 Tax=Catalinimonas alkaloidigena TaxID=1075417 RepID=A0A1G9NBV3_9BACT|nr:TetR family transcriptional regulator C-terminal domain-containing protein [Catalinimonas alkaloidigena]SDL83952.1 DNA-binding transcriptional regulator, AcrR family [Catalinimonas alkaloidigena]